MFALGGIVRSQEWLHFTAGQIDLLAISPPYHLRLVDRGYPVRLNLFEEKFHGCKGALAARRSAGPERNARLAESVLKALAEGGYYMPSANPERGAGHLAKVILKLSDQRTEEETWTYFEGICRAILEPRYSRVSSM